MNTTEPKTVLEQFTVVKRGISYRRVSTDEQADKGFSLPTQLKEIQAYAAKNGIELVKDFYDDFTGSSLDRPGLKAALDYLNTGQANCIICLEADRLTREPGHYLYLRDGFKEWGIELHYAKRGQIDLSDFGQMLVEDFYGRFAAEWKRKLLEACMRGRRGKVEAGNVLSPGRAPYGYRPGLSAEGKCTLTIFEPEARVIRLIFELYVFGDNGAQGIADRLTKEGIPTPTQEHKHLYGAIRKQPLGEWARSTITHVLKNQTYAGLWTFTPKNGASIPLAVPSIISQEVWELAERKRQQNQTRKRGGIHQYLLSGRVTCAHCESAVCGIPMSWPGGKCLYYRCNAAAQKKRLVKVCHANCFRVDKADPKIWDYIKSLLLNHDTLERKLNEYIERRGGDVAHLQTELKQLGASIAKKQGRLARLLELYLDGDFDKAIYQQQKRELDLSISELAGRRQEVSERIAATTLTEDRKALIHHYAEKVRKGLRLADNNENFEVKRQIMNILDVKVTLEARGKDRIAHVSCVVAEDPQTIDLLHNLLSAFVHPPHIVKFRIIAEIYL